MNSNIEVLYRVFLYDFYIKDENYQSKLFQFPQRYDLLSNNLLS